MPFFPLPRTFLDDLGSLAWSDARRMPVLELGCGDGAFTALLRERGIDVVTLDRRRPAAGTVAQVVGDALRPPVREGTCALVVAANLLRQVWPQVRGGRGPLAWSLLPAAGHALYLFEDEPAGEPASARNYRDLQGFLAQLAGVGREPLLAAATFRDARESWGWGGHWLDGQATNTWPADPDRILRWLAGRRRQPGGEADRLCRAIAAEGLSYGSYWWARWTWES